MNVDATTPPDSARDFNSDQESLSPSGSADSSEQLDGRSSADTTPPPQLEDMHSANMSYLGLSKRYSDGSAFSRSYQSAPSADSIAGSIPNGSGFGYYRQHSPSSVGTGEADNELAAALLGCSVNSNGGLRTVHLPSDAPPVPRIPIEFRNADQSQSRPARYLENESLTETSFINSYPSRAPESFTRGKRLPDEDIRMEDSDDEDDRSRARSDEDDDGVFGFRMEE